MTQLQLVYIPKLKDVKKLENIGKNDVILLKIEYYMSVVKDLLIYVRELEEDL